MAQLKLAPGWITYVSELEQMFKYDSEVHIVYDNDECEVKLYVDNGDKAEALSRILPTSKEYGNVILKITIVPMNQDSFLVAINPKTIYETAFKDNNAFAFAKEIKGIFSNNLTYIVFVNKVVQYYNDNLGDIYGNCSTLYQEIAKDLFVKTEGVYYCTDVGEPVYITSNKLLEKPLGEWP